MGPGRVGPRGCYRGDFHIMYWEKRSCLMMILKFPGRKYVHNCMWLITDLSPLPGLVIFQTACGK